MTDFEKIAHLIRFGITFHKMTIQAIIEWADRKIGEQTDQEIFLDLSTARTVNGIVEVFSNRVTWDFNNKEVRNLLLSYYKIYLNGNIDRWLDIEGELVAYFRLIGYDTSNESVEDFLYFLEDDWQLRRDGYGGILQMPAFLVDKLSEYKDYDKLVDLLKRQELVGYEI